jgi:hypothetical protein
LFLLQEAGTCSEKLLRFAQLHKEQLAATSQPRLVLPARKTVDVITRLPATTAAQVRILCLPALLDSGSARLLILFGHFQQLSLMDTNFQLLMTDLACVIVSGLNLEIVGQVKVVLKIPWFS